MPLALVSGIKDSEAEPHLVTQLLYSGIVKDLGQRFYLKAACHPLRPPNSAAGEMESGLRPYERRALSISAPSNEHSACFRGCQLRLQFLGVIGRDVMLPSVMASDPAHDPNALPVEALKKPHVLSNYNPAFRAIQTFESSDSESTSDS
jgi:hypothetical protein